MKRRKFIYTASAAALAPAAILSQSCSSDGNTDTGTTMTVGTDTGN